MRCVAIVILFITATLFRQSTPLAAPPKAHDLVKVEVLADTTSIAKDHSFVVGVRFQITPGWHVYWTNPGDAGMATTVTLKLPPGFSAGPLQFPTPHVFRQEGEITAYGYAGEVVLLSRITAPTSDAALNAPFTVTAETNYLVCEKICLPGSATVVAKIDPAAKVETSVLSQIHKWQQAVPVNVPVTSTPATDGAIEVRGPLGSDWSNDPITFIPGQIDSVTIETVSVVKDGESFIAKLKLSAIAGQKVAQDCVECLLTQNSEKTVAPRGLSFNVPLASVAGASSQKP